jgi:hypothetical protein
MITPKDIVFLNDYIQFGYLNHYVTALSYCYSVNQAKQLEKVKRTYNVGY